MGVKQYIGIDIGGTKIASAIIDETGQVLAREKNPTPKDASPDHVLQRISDAVHKLLADVKLTIKDINGIGVGVPGIVSSDNNLVIITPNINLSQVRIATEIRNRFHCPTAAGNDVNLGLLGEQWLGSAKDKRQVLGLFPGTGVGGAIITNGHLYTGFKGGAAEMGHIQIDENGPQCTCQNVGCLEAYAGRWAIEQDIKTRIQSGESSIVTELTDIGSGPIKSKILKKALKADDPLITQVIDRVCQKLGQACISFNHLFNPEVIIMGGGVVEACGEYMIPRIQKVIENDPFFKDISYPMILCASLGDDAVILGAVAHICNVMKDPESVASYPDLNFTDDENVKVDQRTIRQDFFIRADGKIRRRKKKTAVDVYGSSKKLGPEELNKICRKHPQTVILGLQENRGITLTSQGKSFLKNKGINFIVLPPREAIEQYNESQDRRAILINLTSTHH